MASTFGPTEHQGSYDAWTVAKDQFLDGLDETEKALFRGATLENIFYDANNDDCEDRKQSKSRGIVQSIQPLVSAIEDYGKALDAYANIASLYLAPIWGSIRVVLVIASNHGRFFERITDTFGRIGDILPRFRDYQRIFDSRKHQRFTNTLSEAYLDIIVICTEFKALLRDQKKSSMKRIFQPLSPKINAYFADIIKRFRQHRKDVDKEAEVCHMIEEKEARDLVLRNNEIAEARERVAKRQKLLSLLFNMDYEYKHRRMQKIRHPGTGTWIFATPEFKEFLNCGSSAVICCYGIPGCGKSVLTSSILDGLKCRSTERKTLTTFYYCDYADKRTLEPLNIFRSLARQILNDLGELPSSVMDVLTTACNDARVPELEDITHLILEAIKQIPILLMIIDGLDELNDTDRQSVFLHLRELLGQAGSSLMKIFLASREDTTYLTEISAIPNLKIRMSANSISKDIDSYVNDAVRHAITSGELVLGNPELEKEISSALAKGAKGMFLWVKFQLDDLIAAETDKAIKKVLQNLPRDLGETYDRLLGRIEGAERQEYVRKMFNWIVCARRPLVINELREAIAFSIEDTEWNPEKIPNNINRLIRSCGNLIVVDEDTEIVQLAHFTVHQYLLDQNRVDQYFNIVPVDANFELGKVCVAYLSFLNFEVQVTKYSDNVTPGLTVLKNAIHTQSLQKTHMGSIGKALIGIRRHHPVPANIVFDRHINLSNLEPITTGLEATYSLLSYSAKNWLHHTTNLARKQNESKLFNPRAIDLYDHLLFEKSLLLGFKPWGQINFDRKDSYQLVFELIWGISNSNLALIEAIKERNPHIFLNIEAASWWFFGEVDSHMGYRHISQEMDSRLRDYSFDALPRNYNVCSWLYYQLLWAIRRGEIDILICVFENFVKHLIKNLILSYEGEYVPYYGNPYEMPFDRYDLYNLYAMEYNLYAMEYNLYAMEYNLYAMEYNLYARQYDQRYLTILELMGHLVLEAVVHRRTAFVVWLKDQVSWGEDRAEAQLDEPKPWKSVRLRWYNKEYLLNKNNPIPWPTLNLQGRKRNALDVAACYGDQCIFDLLISLGCPRSYSSESKIVCSFQQQRLKCLVKDQVETLCCNAADICFDLQIMDTLDSFFKRHESDEKQTENSSIGSNTQSSTIQYYAEYLFGMVDFRFKFSPDLGDWRSIPIGELHEIITLLFEKGFRPPSDNSNEIFWDAIIENSAKLMEYLIPYKAEFSMRKNPRNLQIKPKLYPFEDLKQEVTPLDLAIILDNLEIVQILLHNCFYVEGDSAVEHTPLHHAILAGSFESVKLLHEFGASIHVKNKEGYDLSTFAQMYCKDLETKIRIVDFLKERSPFLGIKPGSALVEM